MVNVYSQVEGFPNKNEQPDYYKMPANVGSLKANPKTKLLIAISSRGEIQGE